MTITDSTECPATGSGASVNDRSLSAGATLDQDVLDSIAQQSKRLNRKPGWIPCSPPLRWNHPLAVRSRFTVPATTQL